MNARKATPKQPRSKTPSFVLPEQSALITRPLGMKGWARYEPVLLAALATEEPMLLICPHGSAKSFLRVIEELVQNCLDADQEYLMDSEVDARAAGLYGNQCCESRCCIEELHEPGK